MRPCGTAAHVFWCRVTLESPQVFSRHGSQKHCPRCWVVQSKIRNPLGTHCPSSHQFAAFDLETLLLQPGSLTQGKSLIDAYRKNRDVGLLQVLFWNSGTIKDRGCRRLPALSGYLPAGLRAGDCLHAGKHEAAHAHDSRTRPPLWTATGEKIQIRSGSFWWRRHMCHDTKEIRVYLSRASQ